MGLLKEFQQFAIKGSAADMGIGIVLGAAFSGLIDSLVKDILLPPFGLLLAKMDISNLFLTLSGGHFHTIDAAQKAGAITINYGLFISSFIRFVIIIFVVFLVIRQLNRWKKPHQHPVVSMSKKDCPYCFTSIPSQAIKCPNCGSDLMETKRSRKINIR